MTTILVALDVPTPTGVDAGAPGTLYFTPTRRRNVDGHVVLPAAFSVELVAGEATVELAPTGPDWCWQVQENTRLRHTRHVAAPDTATHVPYTELVDVDPATLEPSPESLAGWDAVLGEHRQIRDDIVQAIGLGGGGTGGVGPEGPPGADGAAGTDGLSAYEVAVAAGFVGDEQSWLVSLQGPQGPQGTPGADGAQGPPGVDGAQGPQGAPGADGADAPIDAIRSDTIARFESITHAAYHAPEFTPTPDTAYLVGPEVV